MTKPDDGIPDSIRFTSHAFLKILETLVYTFDSAGESIIFQMGKENGIDYASNIINDLPDNDGELKTLFNQILTKASEDGWATMVIHEFKPQEGVIEVILKNNVFKPMCLKLNLPQCFFLRGYLSGILKELTNLDYIFFSSHCYALGDNDCSIRLIAYTK